MPENVIGEPISRVMISAMSPISAVICAATCGRISPRSAGVMRGHGPWSKAVRAAATALSMSASVPSGTRATTSSVDGRDHLDGVGALRGHPVAADEQAVVVPNRHASSPGDRRARAPAADCGRAAPKASGARPGARQSAPARRCHAAVSGSAAPRVARCGRRRRRRPPPSPSRRHTPHAGEALVPFVGGGGPGQGPQGHGVDDDVLAVLLEPAQARLGAPPGPGRPRPRRPPRSG